jgi:hypothetical protein
MKLVLAALVTLALAPAAHAECAIQTWIGTPSGTALPPSGTLYIYDDSSDAPDHLTRVPYDVGLDTTFDVTVGWETTTYPIDPQWKAPREAPRVIQYWHHASEWTCSHADSWMIQVDQPTAAFVVQFTSIDDIGTTIEYIEPAKTGADGRSVLEIGKHDCIGSMKLSPEQLAAGGVLELWAIRFDGTRVQVTGLPQMMKTSEMRTSEGGVDEAIGFAVAPPAPPPAPPIVTNAASGEAFLVIAAAGVGLLFIGMMLAGRKRAPTPVQM